MNSLDPRSPVLNRTPIVFDCLADERSFNLDDTFADLFQVEKSREQQLSAVPRNIKQLEDPRSPIQTIPRTPIVCKHAATDDDKEDTKDSDEKPTEVEVEVIPDPRSPTIEMTRTPITFVDDEEAGNQIPKLEKPKLYQRPKKLRTKIFNENYELLNTPTKAPISKLATHCNGNRTPLGNINENKMSLRSSRQLNV